MGRFADFLERLADDETLQAQFDDDPDGTMSDLSDTEKDLVRGGKPKDVKDYLREKEGVTSGVYILRMLPPS